MPSIGFRENHAEDAEASGPERAKRLPMTRRRWTTAEAHR